MATIAGYMKEWQQGMGMRGWDPAMFFFVFFSSAPRRTGPTLRTDATGFVGKKTGSELREAGRSFASDFARARSWRWFSLMIRENKSAAGAPALHQDH